MSSSWSDWLTVVQPRLMPFLADERALDWLHAMGHHLPGDCLGALEVRLGRAAGAVDLSVRLLEPDQARSLARQLTTPHLKDFLVRWAGKDPALAPVRSIWLEFDQDLDRDGGGTAGELPQPVVSAKLMPDAGFSWVMDTLLPALRGRPLSPALAARFRDCHQAIPAPGYLLYVFDLAPRGTDAVRLEIFGLDLPGIAEYLQRIVPGIAGRVEEAVSFFAGAERLHLSVDAGEEVSPRVGIEGSFPRLPKREPRWEELFDRLCDQGLCDPGKRDAALAWPGYDSFWTAPERWPTEAAGGGGFCVRLLSHLKVVSWPDREAEAKAYLLAGYQPAQKVSERSVRS